MTRVGTSPFPIRVFRRAPRWAGAVALSAALVACGSSGKSGGPLVTQPAASSTTLKLSNATKDLLALLAKGKNVVYHATYSAAVSGSSVSIELWQKPPLARRDTVFNASGTSSTRTEEFKLADQLVGCLQQGGGAWKCTQEPAGSQDPSDAVVSNVGQALSGRDVTEKDQTISGRPVRCYSAPAVGTLQAVEICLTADNGIPVLVDAGSGKITLDDINTQVPDSVFSLPAAPTSVTTTTSAS